MKKLKMFAIILIVGIAIFQMAYLSSCQKKAQPDKISSQTVELLGMKLDAVNIEDYKGQSLNKNSQLERDDLLVKNSFYADLVNDNFTTLLNKLKIELTGDLRNCNSKITTLILFSNKLKIEDIKTDLQAITTLEKKGNKLEHKLYEIKNGNTIEKKEFTTMTDYIHHGDIYNELLLFTTQSNSSWTMFSDNTKIKQFGYKNSNGRLNTLSKLLTLNSKNNEPSDGKGCKRWPSCGTNADSHCEYYVTWHCYVPPCQQKTINDTINNYALVPNSQFLSTDSAHNFRDNFMRNYLIGEKYINYYYKLSNFSELYTVINVNTAYDWYLFSKEVYSIADKIQFASSNEIIITQDFKNKAQMKINQYKALNSDSELQSILTNIELDLNNFLGKTKQQILSEIQ